MDTMAEARYLAEEWKAIYNHERPHRSLDGMTPKRYWESWMQFRSPGSRSGYTSRGCVASTGRWITSWDNKIHTSASTVQIDHTVPVHEAWGSGARYWTQARRVAFFNDLGDTRVLNAQTSALNSAKQASGPEAWMPPANKCAYIAQWTATKIRWGLRVDSTEKAALIRWADACTNVTLSVTRV